MSNIDKIRNRIEGLQSLLQMSIRIGEPQYTRSIRNTITEYERELKILNVQRAHINENQD
jgi:hypothetical protein